MRRLGSIRIFWIFVLLLVAAVFVFGFFLGQLREQIKYENITAQEGAAQPAEGAVNAEIMAEYTGVVYVVREENGYLVVYREGEDDVYMQTGISVNKLPEELLEKLDEGMIFYNLETLYNFLENYSI